MTTTLNSLPADIKFTILSHLSTPRSLSSLCAAYPAFSAVYAAHKPLLDSRLLYGDALKNYPRESLWLARHHDKLGKCADKGIDPAKDLYAPMLEYIAYPHEVPAVTALAGDENAANDIDNWREVIARKMADIKSASVDISGDADDADDADDDDVTSSLSQDVNRESIVQNHRAILEIYDCLVTSKLPAANTSTAKTNSKKVGNDDDVNVSDPLATQEEERRIVSAIYKFLVGLNIQMLTTPDRRHRSADEEYFVNVLRRWGFWETVAVRAVRDFFVDRFAKIQETLSVNGSRAGAGGIRAPDLPYQMILLHEFPATLPQWLQPSIPNQTPAKTARRSRLLLKRHRILTRAYQSTYHSQALQNWGTSTLFFANLDLWLSPQTSSSPSSPTNSTSGNNNLKRNGEELPIQRHTRNSNNRKNLDRKRNTQLNPPTLTIPSTDRLYVLGAKPPLDPYVSLWDLTRLQRLGYHHVPWKLVATEPENYILNEISGDAGGTVGTGSHTPDGSGYLWEYYLPQRKDDSFGNSKYHHGNKGNDRNYDWVAEEFYDYDNVVERIVMYNYRDRKKRESWASKKVLAAEEDWYAEDMDPNTITIIS